MPLQWLLKARKYISVFDIYCRTNPNLPVNLTNLLENHSNMAINYKISTLQQLCLHVTSQTVPVYVAICSMFRFGGTVDHLHTDVWNLLAQNNSIGNNNKISLIAYTKHVYS